MKREIYLTVSLFIGICGTVGGWWMLLTMFNLAPPLQYSILSLIIQLCTLTTLFTALVFGGPYVIYDAIDNYRHREEG